MKQVGSLVNPAFLPDVFDAVPKEEIDEAKKKSRIKKLKASAKEKQDDQQ